LQCKAALARRRAGAKPLLRRGRGRLPGALPASRRHFALGL